MKVFLETCVCFSRILRKRTDHICIYIHTHNVLIWWAYINVTIALQTTETCHQVISGSGSCYQADWGRFLLSFLSIQGCFWDLVGDVTHVLCSLCSGCKVKHVFLCLSWCYQDTFSNSTIVILLKNGHASKKAALFRQKIHAFLKSHGKQKSRISFCWILYPGRIDLKISWISPNDLKSNIAGKSPSQYHSFLWVIWTVPAILLRVYFYVYT